MFPFPAGANREAVLRLEGNRLPVRHSKDVIEALKG
jgi:hypothetical protein